MKSMATDILQPMSPVSEVRVPPGGLHRLLLIEDSLTQALKTRHLLQDEGYDVTVCRTGEEGLTAARSFQHDMVLLDVNLPGTSGFDVCQKIKSNPETRDIPVLMLTAHGRVEDLVEGIESGADDYVTKPFHELELKARIKSLLRTRHLQMELVEKNAALMSAYKEIEQLAITDSLTELYNRRFFNQRIVNEVERAKRFHTPLSSVMIDVDCFKRLNDTHGHLTGDSVLRVIADILKAEIRQIDIAARFGGEEFILLLPETVKAGATVLAERIRVAVMEHDFGQIGQVTVSAGVAELPQSNDVTSEYLINLADGALYRAKMAGRNRVVTE